MKLNLFQKSKKNRKNITFDKLQAIVRLPEKRFLLQKYPGGLSVFFIPDENVYTTQRMILGEKVQNPLDKMKIISIQQLNKMNDEAKKFSERGDEFRRANEMVNSELLTLFNKRKG